MAMGVYVRTAGTCIAGLIWLAITVRAAGSVGAERDRQTLDSLLASPITNEEILLSKWIGSIAAVRWLFLVLGIIWLMGLATGGLTPLGFVLATTTLVVYSGFFCSLGLFCSVHCTTSLRAMLWAVATAIFLGGAHLFCTMTCMAILLMQGGGGPSSEWPLFFLLGETPIFVIIAAALQGWEFERGQVTELYELAMFCFVGICTYGLAAIFLWAASVERFKHSCGRVTGARRFAPVDSPPRRDKPESIPASGGAAGP
jgi:ABC-type transport system involved in multi-copper enzyme maturation permease subunit